jgi:hypothetical protein
MTRFRCGFRQPDGTTTHEVAEVADVALLVARLQRERRYPLRVAPEQLDQYPDARDTTETVQLELPPALQAISVSPPLIKSPVKQ